MSVPTGLCIFNIRSAIYRPEPVLKNKENLHHTLPSYSGTSGLVQKQTGFASPSQLPAAPGLNKRAGGAARRGQVTGHRLLRGLASSFGSPGHKGNIGTGPRFPKGQRGHLRSADAISSINSVQPAL